MGRSRTELQKLLESLLESRSVYFQPPTNVQIEYPAIVYSRDYSRVAYADNEPYRKMKRYQVMVIDRNPDTQIPDKIEKLRLCLFNRFYVADELNHYVFNLYF